MGLLVRLNISSSLWALLDWSLILYPFLYVIPTGQIMQVQHSLSMSVHVPALICTVSVLRLFQGIDCCYVTKNIASNSLWERFSKTIIICLTLVSLKSTGEELGQHWAVLKPQYYNMSSQNVILLYYLNKLDLKK